MKDYTIVTAAMLPNRQLVWKASNAEIGHLLTHPASRFGTLLFPPTTPGRWHINSFADMVWIPGQRDGITLFLPCGHTTALRTTTRGAPPTWYRDDAWYYGPQDPRPLYATTGDVYVSRRTLRRVQWVIDRWFELLL